MLKNLVISLTLLTFTGFAKETLHTTNEVGQHQCNRLSDVIDEENYQLIKEVVKCEIAHNSLCSSELSINQ